MTLGAIPTLPFMPLEQIANVRNNKIAKIVSREVAQARGAEIQMSSRGH
jgi:glutamate formiminotransferase